MLSKQEIAGLRELLAKATPVVSHTRIPVPRQTLAALLDIAEAALPVVCECGSTAVVRLLDAQDNVISAHCNDCGKPKPLAGEVANG